MIANAKRVMFVDDEEGVRRSWDRLLSDRGFEVTTAEDGERAISRLRDQPAEVVVSDLKMPGVDGLQLLEWLHESQPQTRFILLTGYGNDVVERRARDLGAYEYLNKPISPETLSMVITAAMQLDRQSQAAAAAPGADVAASLAPEMPILAAEETVVAEVVGRVEPLVAARPAEDEEEAESALKTAGKLVLAPIAGLAFVIFLPVIGFGMFFWVLAQAIRKHRVTATA